jgi:hypothetical protein
MSRKLEKNKGEKEGGKGRTIKKQKNEKGGKGNKKN